MARGFLSGVLWGGVVSVGVAGVASVMMPLPQSPAVDDMAPGAVDAPLVDTAASGSAKTRTDTAPAAAGTAPQATAPAPDSEAALGTEAQSSAVRPVTGSADRLQAPAGTEDTGGVSIVPDAPVLPNPQALAPMSPPATDNVAINTDPGLPQQPVTQSADPAFAAAPEVGENAQPPAATNAATPQGTSKPELAGIAKADQAPQTPQPATAPVQEEAAQTATAVEETPTNLPKTKEDTSRPSIGKPAISLTERDSGVTINRGPDAAAEEEPETASLAATADPVVDDGPALKVNAEIFENPEGKPLMAIVLIDDGETPVTGAAGIAALRSFPYPLSFAINALAPDAAERIALYRAEGLEVLIEFDLPNAATAGDAEALLGTALTALPGAVAVLEGTKTGVQGSKAVSDQVTAILGQTGHGLVTQDKGLNTMPKLARKAGVAADPVFRDFDSKGQSATVIRRFLDQAAFRAGQDGGVIMLGRLRADTISALLLWGLQDRAGKVALAPISAVLSREE